MVGDIGKLNKQLEDKTILIKVSLKDKLMNNKIKKSNNKLNNN
jgi:hypothetical protein